MINFYILQTREEIWLFRKKMPLILLRHSSFNLYAVNNDNTDSHDGSNITNDNSNVDGTADSNHILNSVRPRKGKQKVNKAFAVENSYMCINMFLLVLYLPCLAYAELNFACTFDFFLLYYINMF